MRLKIKYTIFAAVLTAVVPVSILTQGVIKMMNLRITVPAAAPEHVIKEGKKGKIKMICCDTAQVGVTQTLAKLSSMISISGTPENFFINVSTAGAVSAPVGICTSIRNQFEECKTEVELSTYQIPEDVYKKSLKKVPGIIDNDTAFYRVQGTVEVNIDRDSRREFVCTENARLTALKELGVSLFKDNMKSGKTIRYRIPPVWLECKTGKAKPQWSSCECTGVFYEKGLVDNVKNSLVVE